MKTVAMVDLDGVLADSGWRAHLINPELKVEQRFHEYHKHCYWDCLLSNTVRFVRRRVKNGFGSCYITTARPESVRNSTEMWLDLYNLRPLAVLMRAPGDLSSSPELKVKMLRAIESTGAKVEWAFDDRLDVLAALRDSGVPRLYCVDQEGTIYEPFN